MKLTQHLFSNGLVVVSALSFVSATHAQSNITLYGVVDDGLAYVSNQNGSKNIYLNAGVYAGNRWGLMGTENLGGCYSAIFRLEQGFNLNTGVANGSNMAFQRQAYMGLANTASGTVTVGRQYPVYWDVIGPYTPLNGLTGATGAHPGDIDGFDTGIRYNNSVKYMSPKWSELQGGLMYALGGQPGSLTNGSAFSAGLHYDHGPAGFAVAYQQLRNVAGSPSWNAASASSFGISSLNTGYTSAASVQYAAMLARYTAENWMVGLNYSNVRFKPGSASLFRDTAVFNTYGAIASYTLSPETLLMVGYSYTRASSANGITDAARYHQIALSQNYNLSKRTTLYLLETYQFGGGQTLNAAGAIVAATASVGDSQNATPSSNGRQFVTMFGIKSAF